MKKLLDNFKAISVALIIYEHWNRILFIIEDNKQVFIPYFIQF